MSHDESHQLDRPRGRPLPKWGYEFANWWVQQSGRVSVAQQEAVATAFAREPVSYKTIKRLKREPEFVAYCERLREGARAAAAAKFEAALPVYVDAHLWAVEKAIEAEDYRAVPPITTPALDRVWPKRVVQDPSAAQQVVITLTAKQLESINAPPVEVEWEELDDEDS